MIELLSKVLLMNIKKTAQKDCNLTSKYYQGKNSPKSKQLLILLFLFSNLLVNLLNI
jgi:hypothetical protein